MACAGCSADETIATAVPETSHEYAPDTASVVTICGRCLTIESAPAATAADSDRDPELDPDPDPDPDFSQLSDAFPTRPKRAVPLTLALALMIDRCDSLVTNREAIDPDRRRQQLEQLLYCVKAETVPKSRREGQTGVTTFRSASRCR